MIKNWGTLIAFGGYGYRKTSADNNKKRRPDGRNLANMKRVHAASRTLRNKIGRAGLISARQITEKEDGIVGRRNARRES